MHEFEKVICYSFKDITNLARAMDNKLVTITNNEGATVSERFNMRDAILGDAILDVIVVELLNKDDNYPTCQLLSEECDNLTNNDTQIKVLEEWNFKKFIILGNTLFKNGVSGNEQPKTSADHIPYLEAIVYRIYCDSGIRSCKKWVKNILFEKLKKNRTLHEQINVEEAT